MNLQLSILKKLRKLDKMEKWQIQRIQLMKEILPILGDKFILKGGTALMLYHNLDRYSEDIDLDSKTENMDITNKLKTLSKNYKKFDIKVKKNTDTVFRVMINYGSENEKGNYPLKIEISSRNKNNILNGLLDYETKNKINVYSLNRILKMKIDAFNDRDKIRDFYDLAFYLNTNPKEFNTEMVLSFKNRMDYKNLDDLAQLIEEEFNTYNLKFIDGHELVFSTYDNLENELKNRIK